MALSHTTHLRRRAAACAFAFLALLAGCSSDGAADPVEGIPDADFSEEQQELDEVQQELLDEQAELLEEQRELSEEIDELESEIDDLESELDIDIDIDAG